MLGGDVDLTEADHHHPLLLADQDHGSARLAGGLGQQPGFVGSLDVGGEQQDRRGEQAEGEDPALVRPDDGAERVEDLLKILPGRLRALEDLLTESYIWKARTQGIGYLDLTGCMALGITGPVLRSTGLPHDLRKSQPYCGYETYDFDVITDTGADCYGRYLIRVGEMHESLKIVRQCLDRLEPGPVMITDKKLAWPADLKLGPDGLGNSPEHIAKIMGTSMEGLIHHFKLVTEGIRVPAGQVYTAVESPRGELGVHMVSDGGTRPYRVHYRDPSFTNLQAVAAMCEGGMVADVIAAVASIDPVMGGVDR